MDDVRVLRGDIVMFFDVSRHVVEFGFEHGLL
jgi:hypothetical protein